MLPFPYSILVLPAAVALGLAYLKIDGPNPWRWIGRGGILAGVCALPFLTAGPGQAQVILGLCVGYIGMRMAALAQRHVWHGPGRTSLALIHLEPLFQPRATPWSRPGWLLVLGMVEVATCGFLLWLGYDLSLWQDPSPWRHVDNLLVFSEVAVGAAGLHHGLVGVAALHGHHVCGLQDRPLCSASLSEFWGKRWNRLVQCHLEEGFFRPVVRAGHPRLALFAAFSASGVFHLLVLADGGSAPILMGFSLQILGFFLVHGALVMLERRLGWHHAPPRPWPLFLARVRSLILFILLSPILLDPFARLAHVHGRRVEAPSFIEPARAPEQGRCQGPAPLPQAIRR